MNKDLLEEKLPIVRWMSEISLLSGWGCYANRTKMLLLLFWVS